MVSHPACGQPDSFMEGSPNGMAAVLKTAVLRDVGVQVPHPPQKTQAGHPKGFGGSSPSLSAEKVMINLMSPKVNFYS